MRTQEGTRVEIGALGNNKLGVDIALEGAGYGIFFALTIDEAREFALQLEENIRMLKEK